jgi:hypothetical protein
MIKVIEINREETSHQIAIETATIFDNKEVFFQRMVRTKLTGDETARSNPHLTVGQLKRFFEQLKQYEKEPTL